MAAPEDLIAEIIQQYGLVARDFSVSRVGSGYIHYTFKLSGPRSFILQRVNKDVFKQPEVIASNMRHAAAYLKKNFPDFLFLSVINTKTGAEMVYDSDGFPWRLYPYIDNTYTVDKVASPEEAYSAAAQFGTLCKKLEGVDVKLFQPTIERFHDLNWRYEQFESAIANASAERLEQSRTEVTKAKGFRYLVTGYSDLIESGTLKLRITHNDTKINNILFESTTGKALCAIDLDTLMPGYFIYDLGDMIRTFVSPVDEEEKDLSKIEVRQPIYEAVINGYVSAMNDSLTKEEKKAIGFSGMMMTYIMALRMLTDFLNGDIYYQIRYPGQNLVRAKNQFCLLEKLGSVQ
jgi:hypothetical protein